MLLHPIDRIGCPPGMWLYRQPESGLDFKSSSLDAMLKEIAQHRRSNPHLKMDVAYNFQHRLLHDICVQTGCRSEPNPYAEGYSSPLEIAGAALWNELHDRARNYPIQLSPDDIRETRKWFAGWMDRIPTFEGCACRKHFEPMLEARPIDLSSRQAFWEWSVKIHADVSERIGKKRWRVTGECQAEPE